MVRITFLLRQKHHLAQNSKTNSDEKDSNNCSLQEEAGGNHTSQFTLACLSFGLLKGKQNVAEITTHTLPLLLSISLK